MSIDDLRQMAGVMAHRGPDHTAAHVDGPFGCAHNRLSLLDPSPDSHQPFVGSRGALVYNGEIYNFQALRETLADDAVLRGSSDTSVLYELLCRDGVEATVSRLRGMFAFAFWEARSSRLYLVRDRLGIKPLYWTCRGRDLLFASEVKALRRAANVKLDPIKALYSVAGHGDHSHHDTGLPLCSQRATGSHVGLRAGRRTANRALPQPR